MSLPVGFGLLGMREELHRKRLSALRNQIQAGDQPESEAWPRADPLARSKLRPRNRRRMDNIPLIGPRKRLNTFSTCRVFSPRL
jgi:hypothetical protein